MGTQGNPSDAGQVPCEICMKEVPISEATSVEATDYVVHFCGLECYAKWKSENPNTTVEPLSSDKPTG